MKRKNVQKLLALVISGCMVLGGCGKSSDTAAEANQDSTASEQETDGSSTQEPASTLKVTADMADFKDDDVYEDWKSGTYTDISLEGDSAKAGENGTGTTIKGSVITINQSGTYVFSGTLEDGQIVVDVDDTEKVRIVLNGADINCSAGPAVLCTDADKLIISLEDGTENKLSDGKEYTSEDYTAAVYSKADLVFNGTGTLTVQANYNNGIQSKDDLRIMEGVYNITSADDGLVGKDKVAVKDGTFTITSEGDGIKSTNDVDEEKGFIYIGDGKFTIESGADGIQAETGMLIEGGEFSIVADGGAENAVSTGNAMGQFMSRENRKQAETVSQTDDRNGQQSASAESAEAEETGSKGIKAVGCLDITGGTFVIDASDDTLHTNYAMTIDDGDFTLTAGDDAVHADEQMVLNGGTFMIPQCVEGLESADLTINGGEYDITASDDAINGAGGEKTDSDMTGQMPGGGTMPEDMEIPEGGEMPEGMEIPEGGEMPEGMEIPEGGEMPEGMEIPEGGEMPEGMEIPEAGEMPEGMEIPEAGEMPEGMEIPEDAEMPQGGRMQGRGGNMSQGNMNSGGTTGDTETAPAEGKQGDWGQKDMGGGMGMLSTSSGTLTITGGYIVARSSGDGIDVNGSVYMTGGTVIVEGPENDGNAALDYDYSFVVDGGTFTAVGSSGMMQTISSESQITFFTAVFNEQQANQTVTVKDAQGNVVTEYTPSKVYESLIFASEDLVEGENYQIYAGETLLAEVTAE
ncbi:MAG: carbohydrate-binding domain-containing protein [Lachnospiraceae bacterium]|nr:carbohydrate-binding domain-containing protein [Lachnospiraceae bacterium]